MFLRLYGRKKINVLFYNNFVTDILYIRRFVMQEVKTDDYFKKIVNVAVKENLLQMDLQCPLG